MVEPDTQVYTSIPPTSDTNYWTLKSTEGKTQAFVPIDKDLHRELLAKKREWVTRSKLANQEWRRAPNGAIIMK